MIFTPNGKKLVTTRPEDGKPHTILTWDSATGKEIGRVSPSSYWSVGLTADEVMIATRAQDDNTMVRVLDAVGKELGRHKHDGKVMFTAFDSGGTALFVADVVPQRVLWGNFLPARMRVWNLATTKEIATCTVTNAGEPNGPTFVYLKSATPGWRIAADYALGTSPEDRKLSTDIELVEGLGSQGEVKEKRLRRLQGHDAEVQCVAFTPNGKLLASGSADKTIKVWDVDSGKNLGTLHGSGAPVTSVAFYQGDKGLISVSADHTISIWDLDARKRIAHLPGHSDAITFLALSPDRKTLAAASADRSIKLWTITSGKLMTTLRGHADSITCLAFSQDGTMLASGSADKSIKVWRIAGGK
jgi:WD40 repeat protein